MVHASIIPEAPWREAQRRAEVIHPLLENDIRLGISREGPRMRSTISHARRTWLGYQVFQKPHSAQEGGPQPVKSFLRSGCTREPALIIRDVGRTPDGSGRFRHDLSPLATTSGTSVVENRSRPSQTPEGRDECRRTDMMTDHELTEMVLRVMRQQLEEKMNGSAGSGLQRGALDCLEQRSPAEQDA